MRMMGQYYVQDIAANYLKNLYGEPEEYTIHPANLHGLQEPDMKAGYRALLALFGRLYRDIEADPEAFYLLLRENHVPDAKTAEYTQSNKSLLRVPDLLFTFGAWGALDDEGGLTISGEALDAAVKEMKITKAVALMQKLSQYGLMFDGVGKAIKPGDRITLRCADNAHLTAALAATASAMLAINKGQAKKGKEPFYTLNPQLLENAPGKPPKSSLDAMCRTISPGDARTVKRLDQAISRHAKRKVKLSGIMRNDWGCVYTLASNGRIVLTQNVNQDQLEIKMNLAHIQEYTALLDTCPDGLREQILAAWECGHCNPGCAGGFQFSYQDKAYNKCRGGAFKVPGISEDQVDTCLQLLENEVEASGREQR